MGNLVQYITLNSIINSYHHIFKSIYVKLKIHNSRSLKYKLYKKFSLFFNFVVLHYTNNLKSMIEILRINFIVKYYLP